ncbi:MAG: hypothetical protein H6994_03800 [Pseudomonadales bacterium]|nr:hypothetical protein [Pseudomonadales bacterium]
MLANLAQTTRERSRELGDERVRGRRYPLPPGSAATMKLEQLQIRASLRGIVPDAIVSIVNVQWYGSHALELTFKTADGKVANQILYRDNEPQLEIVEQGRPWSFDGDSARLHLGSRTQRIPLPHLFDPGLSIHTSAVDPLPYQITARTSSRSLSLVQTSGDVTSSTLIALLGSGRMSFVQSSRKIVEISANSKVQVATTANCLLNNSHWSRNFDTVVTTVRCKLPCNLRELNVDSNETIHSLAFHGNGRFASANLG